ncbi:MULTISPECIES: hypothetical protein [Streptomyces]|uniref:Carrier domain-containing protein n=1 Tax=Streptomyces katrae TaxID=68223 RepID=A0ABT7GQ08_9ACTN|nr:MULTISPECIES: hypothetical protein [Streptomyces]MDK9495404.1 hypothetical protein [Streptomyces katrae]RST05418.1 hypothetical protein EF910_13395 [Streptomyces sp. WAC07149]GLX23052.1 hypothetical protein Slala01_66960 [Streptomyces lavendulae subsp. lavendulae]GLX30514.1 hypothetical protein Slala02_63340 [Streptomyces lavendulae subsp. lavendulae]
MILDNETVAEETPTFIEEFTELIRRTAAVICAEQPDVPEPEELRDLDSFSMVQVLLDLENELDLKVLEGLEGFNGRTFQEIAEHIAEIAHRAGTYPEFEANVRRIVNADSD